MSHYKCIWNSHVILIVSFLTFVQLYYWYEFGRSFQLVIHKSWGKTKKNTQKSTQTLQTVLQKKTTLNVIGLCQNYATYFSQTQFSCTCWKVVDCNDFVINHFDNRFKYKRLDKRNTFVIMTLMIIGVKVHICMYMYV